MTSNAHLKAVDPLIFDNVALNLGNGFNATAGEFIVPAEGLYLISLTIWAEYRKQVSAEILASDDVLARLTSGYGRIERATSAVTVVKELKPNDKVFVRRANDKTGEYHGQGYTSFCGVLTHSHKMTPFDALSETSLLKTLWEKDKLLVTSNFSFSYSVFYLFG